jgi:hypothetical protein
MPRKLTTGEKRMLILLAVVILAFAYYMLFWKNIAQEIDTKQLAVTAKEKTVADIQDKIGKIPDLEAQLNELLSQENYDDKFFAIDEPQETFLDYLHQLVIDNELDFQSIVFSRQEHELDSITVNQTGLASPAEKPATPIIPKIRVTNAVITFEVPYEFPERFLNMLDTIERSERLTIVNSFTINIPDAADPAAAGNQPATNPANQEANEKKFTCVATIKFVGLDPGKQDEITTEAVPEAVPEASPEE